MRETHASLGALDHGIHIGAEVLEEQSLVLQMHAQHPVEENRDLPVLGRDVLGPPSPRVLLLGQQASVLQCQPHPGVEILALPNIGNLDTQAGTGSDTEIYVPV